MVRTLLKGSGTTLSEILATYDLGDDRLGSSGFWQ